MLPSFHPLNTYPVFGTAVTAVPVFPNWTNCVTVPLSVPPALPVTYDSVNVLIVKYAVYVHVVVT